MAEVITVSALNRYVKSILEGDANLAGIAISPCGMSRPA